MKERTFWLTSLTKDGRSWYKIHFYAFLARMVASWLARFLKDRGIKSFNGRQFGNNIYIV
jgi:hypothetical protein